MRERMKAAAARVASRLRPGRRGLVILAIVGVAGGAFLWALPELIRRQAVAQIPKLTGRAASIEDIDLNLFTRRLVVRNFRLAERDPAKAFVEFERLEARWSWLALLTAHVRLTDLRLVTPVVHLARTGPREFNFSDLLDLIPPADPNAKPAPSRVKFSVDRLGLVLGSIVIRDESVSPPVDFHIQGLTIEAGGLTTRTGQPAGRLALQSKVGGSPLELSSDEIRLTPGAVSLGFTVNDFDLTQVLPYVPPAVPAGPYAGRLGLHLRLELDRRSEGVTRAVVTGDVTLTDLVLIRRGGPAPFMAVPRLSLRLKELDVLARRLVVSDVEIEGLRVEALRDKSGAIDLLKLAEAPPAQTAPAAPPAAPPAAAEGPAGPAVGIVLERLLLSKSTAAFVDESASPPTIVAVGIDAVELAGIDLAWPTRATVARLGVRRPVFLIERGRDDAITLLTLFRPKTAPGDAAPKPAPPPAPAPAPAPAVKEGGAKGKGLLDTMRLELGEIRVEDGSARFLDRSTKPMFSEDFSRLEVTVAGLSNRAGQRAKVSLKSVVGADAGLDLRGEVGPIGQPPLVDLVGVLRDYRLPTVNPYADRTIAWIIRRGDFKYDVHIKLEGDQLTVNNDVFVGHLQVAKSPERGDEVKQRLGLPLGLIVALIKDGNGDIRLSVPVTGSLRDPKFDVNEAIWAAVRNVIVNVLAAPFRLIGRLFASDDKIEELRVDPVTFAIGSSVIDPAMEAHLLRVADFLRGSPYVNLELRPVASEADIEALKAQEVLARLQRFRREVGAGDLASALRLYYQSHAPSLTLPKTVDEQLAALRQREPTPEAPLADLLKRRLDAARERLTKAEGIPPERLAAGAAAPPGAAGDGRVEFELREGEE